jgi:fibronectin type 3 domain-containing protein
VPGEPTNLTARAHGSGIALAWSASSTTGVTYRVYRGTGGSKTLIASGVATLGYTDNANLVKGATYYYQVSAANSTSESAMSNEASAMAH